MAGNLGPTPRFPERADTYYEQSHASPTPGGRGPLRFQENLAASVAGDFMTGAGQGYQTGARDNHNANVYIKTAQETMNERAHPGSAAWTEAPTFLAEFAHGVSPIAERHYEQVDRPGTHMARIAPAVVRD
jgi:hypothetical protein